MAFWLIGTVLAAGFASCLPKTASWPLPTGLGGVIGDAILWLPTALPGPLPEPARMAAATVLGVATLIAVMIATGFGYRDPEDVALDERWAREAAGPEDDDEERTSISLGRLVHGLLSFKARLVRLMRRRSAMHAPLRRAPIPAVSPRDRFEPPLEPASTDFDLEDDEEDAESEPTCRAQTPAGAHVASDRADGYQLPALSLLAASKPSDRFAPSQESIEETATALEGVLGDFGVRGANHQRAARPGGHAVRARARARASSRRA